MPLALQHQHRWDVTPEQARAIQSRLAPLVSQLPISETICTVGGVDVAFPAPSTATAGLVLFSFPELSIVEAATAQLPVSFPYEPGLLSFREVPMALEALGRLASMPDVIICDAHGRAHPRRLGMASHLGVLADLPTLGCAKSRLVGSAETPGPERGSASWLYDGAELIGAVLRTQPKVRPIYVSVGHRIDLQTAISIVLQSTRQHRLPEPLRAAHALATGKGLSEWRSAP